MLEQSEAAAGRTRGSARAADRKAASLRGLDWFNFFVANIQTGFGPFIAVYLTANSWTQAEIGLVLSVGTVTFMISQVPAGAMVDASPNKRSVALLATIAIAASALLFAIWPAKLLVAIAEVLHGFASCALAPAIAAISLALVGAHGLGERVGRNARFAAIGNGIAAGVMGAVGTWVSSRAVFFLTALLTVPGVFALLAVRDARSRPKRAAHHHTLSETAHTEERQILRLLTDRRMLIFALCCAMFHLSNAAMLPLAGASATRRVGTDANLIIAAAVVVPQIVVAALSPWVGRVAGVWGRRPVLLLGYAALPLRGMLLALIPNPYLLVPIQTLDGLSGAVFGVMLPLVSADLTHGTRRFNLCMGLLGLAVGIGATVSTALAGEVATLLGQRVAFLALAWAGLLAVLVIRFIMPETKPPDAPAGSPEV
jgi:MFS family permease